MAEKEIKYIVIKCEDASRLSRHYFALLHKILNLIQKNRESYGKYMPNKYIVCNQDEPYADKVWKIILDGEDEKESAAYDRLHE